MKLSRLAIAVAVLFALAAPASATPIQWNFSNVLFIGPGCPTQCKSNALAGTFTFDANTNAVTKIDINVTGTNVQADYNYKSSEFGGTDLGNYQGAFPRISFFTSPFGNFFLTLYLSAPLTNAGGAVSLLTNSTACNGCGLLATGVVTTTTAAAVPAVPEPATMTLLGLGLAGAAVRRRRARKA